MTRALTALVAATLITTITAAAFWAALTTDLYPPKEAEA